MPEAPLRLRLFGPVLHPDIEISIIQCSGRLPFVRLRTASRRHQIACIKICHILEAACYAGLVHIGMLHAEPQNEDDEHAIPAESLGEDAIDVQSKCDYKAISDNFTTMGFSPAESMKDPAGSMESLLGNFLLGERWYYKRRIWSLEYVGDLEGIVFRAEKLRPEVRAPVSRRMSSRTCIEQPRPWSSEAKDLRWTVPWPRRKATW